MEKEKSKIRVKDVQTDQILFECDMNESEKAHHFAGEMDEMGLSVKVVIPTLTEGLSNALGLSKEAEAAYQKSLEEEIQHHEGSCCFEENQTNH
jgi:hypothetical protein